MQATVVTHKGGQNNMFNQDYIKSHSNLLICCDGHGKEKIDNKYINTGGYASFVITEFLIAYLDQNQIINSFDQAHKYLFQKMKKMLINKKLKVKSENNKLFYYRNNKWKQVAGGTTATIVIYHPEKSSITVSNVGDCFAILFDTKNKTYKILTEDHSPFSYSDYLNLKNKFNFCYGTRYKGKLDFSTQLYDENGIQNSPPKNCRYKNVRGEPYVLVKPKNKPFGLNMTRSLGDFALSDIGISHIPSVHQYTVKKKEILLVASDGFMDNYKFDQLSQLINELSDLDINQIKEELLKDVLIRQKERYNKNGDNLSIGIIKF